MPVEGKPLNVNIVQYLRRFHRAFGHPCPDVPVKPDEQLAKLRVNLIQEELEELSVALDNGDMAETFDALIDLQVVVAGAAVAFGLDRAYADGFEEVMSSNMSKLGEDGQPIYREDGKIMKGPKYRPPNLRAVLQDVFGRSEWGGPNEF